jgi:hypothetical protein
MTPVSMQFLTSTGEPIAHAPVEIRLARSDYDEAQSGIIMPRLVTATTDEQGEATVNLTPCDTMYHVTVYDTLSDAALHYDFYVPTLDVPGTTVRLQDIVVVKPISPKKYDETALLAIQNAKANTLSAMLSAEQARDASITAASDAADSARLTIPTTSALPPDNPLENQEWINTTNGKRFNWLVTNGHGAWVETYASVVVNTPDAAAIPAGVDAEEVVAIVTEQGVQVTDLELVQSLASTDILTITQQDGVERRVTLAELAAMIDQINRGIA